MGRFTGYFKTEGTGTNKYSYLVDNSINEDEVKIRREENLLFAHSLYNEHFSVDGDPLYMHAQDDPDTSYKQLKTDVVDDKTPTEYSSDDTATPIYSAITELDSGVGTVFTSNQTLGGTWKLQYQAKVADVPSGEEAYIEFKFYKVDTSDNETHLFTIEGSVSTAYNLAPRTCSGTASGSVTTDDRLLIKVYYDSRVPT